MSVVAIDQLNYSLECSIQQSKRRPWQWINVRNIGRIKTGFKTGWISKKAKPNVQSRIRHIDVVVNAWTVMGQKRRGEQLSRNGPAQHSQTVLLAETVSGFDVQSNGMTTIQPIRMKVRWTYIMASRWLVDVVPYRTEPTDVSAQTDWSEINTDLGRSLFRQHWGKPWPQIDITVRVRRSVRLCERIHECIHV